MKVSVVLLRRNGVQLDLGTYHSIDELSESLVAHGSIAFGVPIERYSGGANGRASKALLLQQPRSSPGMGVMHELYQPQLVALQAGCIKVRGFEPVDSGAGPAMVMQEWLIRFDH